MTDQLFRCPTCQGSGHHLALESEVPYCQTCHPMVPVKPTYYQTSKGIDPEDVLIDWLTEHGVDKENAYNIAHPLVHSVLYSVGRAVKRAVVDAAVGEETP